MQCDAGAIGLSGQPRRRTGKPRRRCFPCDAAHRAGTSFRSRRVRRLSRRQGPSAARLIAESAGERRPIFRGRRRLQRSTGSMHAELVTRVALRQAVHLLPLSFGIWLRVHNPDPAPPLVCHDDGMTHVASESTRHRQCERIVWSLDDEAAWFAQHGST
jgi:hypothetical protein